MNANKPFAQSCEDNKHVIFEQLSQLFRDSCNVLEIGSGTGQHAVYFAKRLQAVNPAINWQPSELEQNLAGIQLWLNEAQLENIQPPLALDVMQQDWQLPIQYDAAFTANTLHIMSLKHVKKIFLGLGEVLTTNATFCSYGPFNYNGQFSSDSNARFDLWLKERDPESGIRDLDDLKIFAEAAQIQLLDDIQMPANNRLLVWKKR